MGSEVIFFCLLQSATLRNPLNNNLHGAAEPSDNIVVDGINVKIKSLIVSQFMYYSVADFLD